MTLAGALQGLRILVVEDDYLVAETLRDLLATAGAHIEGPIGWLDEALAFVRENGAKLDGAVLDVNLHDEVSYPIADALAERGIRFVLLTGYDVSTLDAAYRNYPRCEKPFRPQAILAAMAPST